jgi:hypothetical protein
VFSHIYQSNLSPSKVAGYRARAGQIGLVVDNFCTEKILNDFNNQIVKSLESLVFIDFCTDFALFLCPPQQGIKKALQAFIAVPGTKRIRFTEIKRCRLF